MFDLLCFFIIYAFFGWCLEVAYQAVEHGKFINRGFLNGPYCPIYGVGMIIVTNILEPIKENIIVLFIGSVMLTTVLELVTGFLLEKIFSMKWWDYSDERFNMKGYICLKFSLLWGIACLVAVRIIHPAIAAFVGHLPYTLGRIILLILMIGFVGDMIFTICAIMKIRSRLALIEQISAEMRKISDKTGEKIFSTVEGIRDKSEELGEKTDEYRRKNAQRREEYRKKYDELREKHRELTEKRSFTRRRIEKAFPKLDLKEHLTNKRNRNKKQNMNQ